MYLCNTKNKQAMTTINVTLPTNKAGKLAVFTIQFEIKNFDAVIDQIENVTIEGLFSSNLWKVI